MSVPRIAFIGTEPPPILDCIKYKYFDAYEIQDLVIFQPDLVLYEEENLETKLRSHDLEPVKLVVAAEYLKNKMGTT